MAKNTKYLLCITRLYTSGTNRRIEFYDVFRKKHWWQHFTSIHPTFLSLKEAHEVIGENAKTPSITVTVQINGKPYSIGSYKRTDKGDYKKVSVRNL